MRVADTARRLVDGVAWDGGATVNPVTGDPFDGTNGYVVGGIVPSEVVKTLSEASAERFVEVHAPYAEGQYVGSWDDGTDVYLDVVSVITDRDEALRVARERGEIAVYDVSRKVSVNVWTGEDS